MTVTATETLTARQQQALATKAHITETALNLFSQQGFAATSTKQIAQEAGVSEGLIFRYFSTKMELLLSIAETRRTFSAEVKVLLENAADQPATKCLPTIADGFVHMMHSELSFLNMIFGESRTNDDLYATFRHFVGSASDALTLYLDERVKVGELRSDLPTESAARAFFSPFILFFLTNKHLSVDEWETQASQYTADVLELWFKGALSDA